VQRLPRLVLVAEDDEVNALIVGAYLDALGVRHERVADGKQAVSRALRETDRPELVLMDCRMPVMDGMAAAADIRRQERTLGLQRVPILALTATAAEADRQACLDAGMDAVVAKPFTPAQLADALRQAGGMASG
jgi:CheY-like chemotaxis protein